MTRVSIKPNVISTGIGTLDQMKNDMGPGLTPRAPAAALVVTVDDPMEQPVAAQPYDLSQMVAEWMSIEYAELSVLLVNLRYLQFVHQTHHWISRGDSFYGDHLLFDRLYGNVTEQIDGLAEKTVGLGCEKNVDVYMQTKQLGKLVSAKYNPPAIPRPDDLVLISLESEKCFVEMISCVREQLDARGQLSYGLDNFLAGLADEHESNVYLLSQRVCKDTLV